MAKDFDLASVDAQDEGVLDIKHPKSQEPTGWRWTFFGPDHPRTREVADRVAREALRQQRAKEQAQVNGKKWKAEDESMDEIRASTVDNIVGRLKEFSPVRINGEMVEFSADRAKAMLLDRKKIWLFDQVYEYLQASENFIQPSASS